MLMCIGRNIKGIGSNNAYVYWEKYQGIKGIGSNNADGYWEH